MLKNGLACEIDILHTAGFPNMLGTTTDTSTRFPGLLPLVGLLSGVELALQLY